MKCFACLRDGEEDFCDSCQNDWMARWQKEMTDVVAKNFAEPPAAVGRVARELVGGYVRGWDFGKDDSVDAMRDALRALRLQVLTPAGRLVTRRSYRFWEALEESAKRNKRLDY